MTTFKPFGDGSFASVAECSGRAYVAFQTDPRVTSEVRVYDLIARTLVQAYATGVGAAFPLLKPGGPRLMVAWRRADNGRIYYAAPLDSDSAAGELGDIGANNEPLAWEGDWLWWQAADFQIKRANVTVGLGRETMIGQVGRGTGLARVVNGRAVLRDFERSAYGLTFPNYAAGHVALEGNTGGLVVVREGDGRVARAFPGADCFTPKIIGWGSGVLAVTSGSGSVRAVAFQSSDFIAGPTRLPDGEPPVIDEPPIDEPPTPRVTTMRIPDPVFATIAAVYDKFSTTEIEDGEAVRRPPAGEDQQRALQQKVCQTVKARHGDQWGWKRSAGDPSADAIAYRERPSDAEFFVWDCCRDAGGPDREFTLSEGAEGELVRQTFIPVDAKDYLAGAPPVDQPTDPPPVVTPPASGDVLERLARIEAKQDQILAILANPLKLEVRF